MTIPSTGPRWHQTVDVGREPRWIIVAAVGVTLMLAPLFAAAVDQRRWELAVLSLLCWETALVILLLIELWRVLTAPQPIAQTPTAGGVPLPPQASRGRGSWPWS